MLFPVIWKVFVHAGLSPRGPSRTVTQVVVGGDPEDAQQGEADGRLAPPALAQVIVNDPLGKAKEAVGQKAIWQKA